MINKTRLSTVVVTGLSLLSAFVGFGRESFIAYQFGATGMTDAYYVAAIVPDMVAGWISYTLTNSMIPILKKSNFASDDGLIQLARKIFWGSSFVLLVLFLLTYFIRGNIIHFMAPGFEGAQFRVSVKLLAIMAISIVFSGLSGILWGVHNSMESYTFPALVGLIFNVLFMITVFVFGNSLGILALGYSFLSGTVGRVLIQSVPLLRTGIFVPTVNLWDRRMIPVVRTFLPIFLSVGVGTLSTIVDRVLASQLMQGSLTELNYASKIGLLPGSLIGMSVATTLYSRFIANEIKKDVIEQARLFMKSIKLLVFLSISIGTIFICDKKEIITLLFAHGLFDKTDVIAASEPLVVYGIFSVFYMLPSIMMHFLYAYRKGRLVAILSTIGVSINIVCSLLLVRLYGIVGLVVANGITQLIFTISMLFFIMREIHQPIGGFILKVLKWSIPPGFIFSIGVIVIAGLGGNWFNSSINEELILCGVGILSGLFLLLIYLMNTFSGSYRQNVRTIIHKINELMG